MKLLLNELYEYREGALYHKLPRPKVRVGERAGSPSNSGHRNLRVQGKMMKEHRAIWIMHHGPIPDGLEVDHLNRIRDDNRIENLRLATRGQNQHNRKLNTNNTSGTKGVYWHPAKGKWVARVWVDKRCIARYLNTEKEAIETVAALRKAHHKEYHNHETAGRD